jgi:hypothetical protein
MPPVQFETATRKMTDLSEYCIALTAGDALAYAELFDDVKADIEANSQSGVDNIVFKIKESYKSLRKRAILERILSPRAFDEFDTFYAKQQILLKDVVLAIQRQIDNYNYGLEILVCGIQADGAHLYTIVNPGTSICFDTLGFHAIGTGSIHAINTLIARECHPDKSLEEVLLIVYEAKKRAEVAPGVGATITDFSLINHDGILKFPRDKINEIDKIYKMWIGNKDEWKEEVTKLIDEIRGN